MDTNIAIFFFISFIGVALVYAIIASTTKIFYRDQSIINLSLVEMKVLNGKATFGNRFSIFVMNLFSSIVAPPIYIWAGIITFIFWFFTS